jgi:hypothetical protein
VLYIKTLEHFGASHLSKQNSWVNLGHLLEDYGQAIGLVTLILFLKL